MEFNFSKQITSIKEYIKQWYCLILYGFYKSGIFSYKNIPIVINNFNRLSYLKILLNDLTIRGYNNIYILDNNSTYPPLLEFYNQKKYKIVYLKKNLGHMALHNYPPLFNKVRYDFFVYTDPDLHIIPECPRDFLKYFLKSLCLSKHYKKVGFGLKTDDLPDHYCHKNLVIEWEKQFRLEKNKFGLFDANIDTTFSLHKPFLLVGAPENRNSMRSDFPYIMQHMPWYENLNQKSEENAYYEHNANKSSSWHPNQINNYKDQLN